MNHDTKKYSSRISPFLPRFSSSLFSFPFFMFAAKAEACIERINICHKNISYLASNNQVNNNGRNILTYVSLTLSDMRNDFYVIKFIRLVYRYMSKFYYNMKNI